MQDDEFGLGDSDYLERPSDPREAEATQKLRAFFESHRQEVFFSRQLEVQNENEYFHWLTNRAIGKLREEGLVKSETRKLTSTGGEINLLWHHSYRFYRRSAMRLVKLVDEYSDPNIGAALGLHGETMILEGFARNEFVMKGRETREFRDRKWDVTEHNLDFIFERDGRTYGIEVKNTLGYMDQKEFRTKILMCRFLRIRPVFAARMLPRTWINELNEAGGYAMVMKYQLYPWTHKVLARRVAKELTLPVDAPRALHDGTMQRFMVWHRKNA